nr:hypothetical protein [Ardenticatena sp.]
MAYWRVETYQIAFAREQHEQTGWVRVRQHAPWEAEVADVRVVSSASSASPFTHFETLTTHLAAQGWHPLTCGACAHFRRPFDETPDMWKGLCTWGEPEDPVFMPTPRALLAPACHAFVPHHPPIEHLPAEEPIAPMTAARPDTEATIAIAANEDDASFWQRVWRRIKRLWHPTPPSVSEPLSPVGPRCPTCGLLTLANARLTCDADGADMVCTLLHCSHCEATFFDIWNESRVETAPQDAAQFYVIPPSLANVVVRTWRICPTPRDRTCACQAHGWFARLAHFLYQEGRRIEPRTCVSTV